MMIRKGLFDGRDKVGYKARFHDVTERSFSEAFADECRILMNRKEHKFSHRPGLMKLVCGFDSGEHRHCDVQDDHIRLQP